MKLIYRDYLSDMHNITLKVWLSALILFLFGCEAKQSDLIKRVAPNQDPFPSTYQIKSHDPFMIVNTSILDGVGNLLKNTDLCYIGIGHCTMLCTSAVSFHHD